MSFFDEARERMSPAALRVEQGAGLRALMEILPRNGFYEAKLEAGGCDPLMVRGVEDLPRLPFTTKGELVAAQRDAPPFGGLNTFPLARYRHLHQTSGTSGQPLRWLDTDDDWETWLRCWGHVYRGADVGEEDLVFGAFSFGPFISHWTAMAGAARVGALRLAGGGLSSKRRLEAIRDSGATVLVCTPTYALHLAEVAANEGIDIAGSAIRVTIHAGEPGASVPNVKRRIEEAWGARAFDHAGATEVGAWGFDCQEADHAIHLNELEFLFEVVVPDTGEPCESGQRGELVITTLGRHGMPVVRYRTGDLVELDPEPCGCGRGLRRIRGGVLGRADDMFIVRGVNLYPAAVDDVVRAETGVVEYEVEIRDGSGMSELVIKLECGGDDRFSAIEASLAERFRSRFGIRVGIEKAADGSLPRYELKAHRYKRVET